MHSHVHVGGTERCAQCCHTATHSWADGKCTQTIRRHWGKVETGT